tara:strand:- start:1141 stop:1386 length:246 start_codon:yes stop_codon:yes gene_type:complete
MSVMEIILVGAIVWWMVFFVTLPFGAHPHEEIEPGMAPSAPARPRLWLKAAVSTVVSIIVVLIVDWLIAADILPSMRSMFG